MILYYHATADEVRRVEADGFGDHDTDQVDGRLGILCWDYDIPRGAGAGVVRLDVPADVAELYALDAPQRSSRRFVLPRHVANAYRQGVASTV
jgi:hypothetical protein